MCTLTKLSRKDSTSPFYISFSCTSCSSTFIVLDCGTSTAEWPYLYHASQIAPLKSMRDGTFFRLSAGYNYRERERVERGLKSARLQCNLADFNPTRRRGGRGDADWLAPGAVGLDLSLSEPVAAYVTHRLANGGLLGLAIAISRKLSQHLISNALSLQNYSKADDGSAQLM